MTVVCAFVRYKLYNVSMTSTYTWKILRKLPRRTYWLTRPHVSPLHTRKRPYLPQLPQIDLFLSQEQVEEVVERYAFPERTARNARYHRLRQQQQQKENQQQQHDVKQGEGEGTDQGRAREQASGESAVGDEKSSSSASTATTATDIASPSSTGETSGVLNSAPISGDPAESPVSPGGVGALDAMMTEADTADQQLEGGDSAAVVMAGGVGDGEAEENGLPVLLLRELASFKARFPSRVGKHLRADAAEEVLKSQVCVECIFLNEQLSFGKRLI